MVTRFDPTGVKVAHGDQEGWLSVSQSTSPQVIWKQRLSSAITTVAWSWDGTYLASGDMEGNIYLWEAHTGVLVQSSKGHRGAIALLVWSPATYQLTSFANREAVFRIWDYSPLLHASQARAGVSNERRLQ